jgi:hypothetical protein
MNKDIKLPYKKQKITWKRFKKLFKKTVKDFYKRAKKYFKTEKANSGKSVQNLIIFGLIIAALALMLGLIPDLNSFGAWLAIMALIIGILVFLNKSGGRAKQLLLLSSLALIVCMISVSIQNGLRQRYINNIIDRKSGQATKELLRKDVEIEVGEFSDDGLKITLYNKNSATKTYSIVVLAKTKDGEHIIEQTISFGTLDPSERKEYKIFNTASGILREKLKSAIFEVTTVSQY